MNIEIADQLIRLRREAGLSQEALVDKLGLSRQAVSKWERAEAAPDMENLMALARLYNISLDELLLFAREPAAEAAPAAEAPPPEAAPAAPAPEPRFDENAIRLLNANYPVLMALIFFAMGMLGDWWHPGWMVFLTIPLYYTLIPALRRRDHRLFAYPVLLALVYLILGFTIDAWAWAWLLFCTIPLYYTWKPGA